MGEVRGRTVQVLVPQPSQGARLWGGKRTDSPGPSPSVQVLAPQPSQGARLWGGKRTDSPGPSPSTFSGGEAMGR